MESKTKKPTPIRTEPRKKAHKKMLELTTNPDMTDQLLKQLYREQMRITHAQQELEEYVKEAIIEGIIERGNAGLETQDQQESLTLYMSDGSLRFSIGRQARRFFDDRVHQAKVFLKDFIDEYEHVSIEASPDIAVLITMLKSLFFGNRAGGKHFKYTPELQAFMSMDEKQLTDDRVLKAQQILKACIHVEKSKWWFRFEKYNEELQCYEAA